MLGACLFQPIEIGEGHAERSAKACDIRYSARTFGVAARLLAAEEDVIADRVDDPALVCQFFEQGSAWGIWRCSVACGHRNLAFPSVP